MLFLRDLGFLINLLTFCVFVTFYNNNYRDTIIKQKISLEFTHA